VISICLLPLLNSCKFSTANFAEVTMSRSVDDNRVPTDPSDIFNKKDNVIHCSVKMANTPKNTKVVAKWYHAPEGEREFIDSTEVLAQGDGWIDFNLSSSVRGFPYSSYEVELFFNEELERTVPFSIQPMLAEGPIHEVVMASDINVNKFPVTQTDVFPSTVDRLHVCIYFEDAPAGTASAAVWYQGGADDERVEGLRSDLELEGSTWAAFSLIPSQPLAPGQYSVDILQNGVAISTSEFSVE